MPNPAKIHANLAPMLQQRVMSAAPAQPLRIIVKYRAGTSAVAASVAGVEATHFAYRLFPATANSASPAGINALSERDDVEMIWYDEPVHTMLDASVPLIGAPQVWQAGFTGKGIKVAVVDTGIDQNHPDLVGRVTLWKDFTGESETDKNGHGTHVAGTIG